MAGLPCHPPPWSEGQPHPLTVVGDDRDWFGVGISGDRGEAVERVFDLIWRVSVDADDFESVGCELRSEDGRGLLS